MFYVFSYTTAGVVAEADAPALLMPLDVGIIHQVDVLFQDGCKHDVFLRIYHDRYQLWPSNRGEKFRGNATVVSFREFYELQPGDTTLTAKIWTDLSAVGIELIIQIGLLPKRIIQPLSFDELLAAAAGIK